MGAMTMREALARSRNTTAVQTIQQVGLENAQQFAKKLGIPLDEIYEPYAIGGLKEGVSPLQMAGAFSAFGNNGFYTEPYTVKKIILRDGTEIDTMPEQEIVMKDYTAFLTTDMLKSAVSSSYGTGRRANVPGLPIAGKTGTTNYTDDEIKDYDIPRGAVPDAWFAGYTTNYTAAVWTGYESRKNYIASGDNQRIAQYLFKNIIEYVSKDVETPDFTAPKTVQRVKIEKGTNPAMLASEFTPKELVLTEWAVKGNAPQEISRKYEKLDIPGQFVATYDELLNEIKLTWDYDQKGSQNSPIEFEISGSLDEGADQLLTKTTEKELLVTKPVLGGIYTFKVIATRGELRSDPAIVRIEIPDSSIIDENEDGEDDWDEGNGQDNGEIGDDTEPGREEENPDDPIDDDNPENDNNW
jgi:penicillin-binding protein 1A